ncbi:ATP-binding protein [Paenisporosarcina quisquiliarum]|uniref:histidine kinase n=1 Tax=Paenisporosarcina quisquiliarum TaxID=365346 RepID=A0A9X3LHR9_9BACL|nr:HAMP domain-containing sensor histidine kinase [Paenisporosarcina quisquiliarum]MCZ8538168.1 ATP-binding protein [Paenisporosarcina quisquiliarum]
MNRFSWLFIALISSATLAVAIFLSVGTGNIGISYYESEDFQWSIENRLQEIGPVLLSRLDVEEAIENLQVEPYEIEQYRNSQGSELDQIMSIQDQYRDLIENAVRDNDTALKAELETARDTKIKDIRESFSDDEAVSEKILNDKKEVLQSYDAYLKKTESSVKAQQKSLAYVLTNVETGETFEFGDITDDNAYKKVYDDREGYLTISSLDPHFEEEYMYSEKMQYFPLPTLHDMVGDTTSQFTGTITIPKNMVSNHELRQIHAFEQSKWFYVLTCLLGLLSVAGAYWLFRTRKEQVLNLPIPQKLKEMKLEVRLIGIIVVFICYLNTYYSFRSHINGMTYHFNLGENIVNTIGLFILAVVFLTLIIVQVIWLIRDIRNDGIHLLWKNSWIERIMSRMQDTFLKRSSGIQLLILIMVIFLAGLGLGGVIIAPVLIVAYAPLFVVVLLPVLYLLFKRVGEYNQVAIATEQLAQGRLISDVHISGKSVLAEHAKNLNMLREGVRMSQSEQAKSERLKTELITNVSHDLRTPLTSIITYTDLLKKVDLTDEERLSYVAILDRKSQRLKTLIEDLFEVSKMASGNMELHKQRVDLTQLMQQALAEHEEDIKASGLDFRIDSSEKPLYAVVDGQKWWRMLDNLIVNAIKYTLPGTRVYVTLKEAGGYAQFIVKNVTKYELGENVDELFERFKRADTSRHTEGSGLGLAIAQSIVDLHGGSLRINVDGDLFKVTVSIKTD